MGNGPFEDVFPIENGDFPLLCLITGVYMKHSETSVEFLCLHHFLISTTLRLSVIRCLVQLWLSNTATPREKSVNHRFDQKRLAQSWGRDNIPARRHASGDWRSYLTWIQRTLLLGFMKLTQCPETRNVQTPNLGTFQMLPKQNQSQLTL